MWWGDEAVGAAGELARSKRGAGVVDPDDTLIGGTGTPWAFATVRSKLGSGRVPDAALDGWLNLLAFCAVRRQ